VVRGVSSATAPTLGRTTFRTSRLLDFCSRKELIAQTGHREVQWPLVALKELVDNAPVAGPSRDWGYECASWAGLRSGL
jgi:hypothetical protein